MFYCVIRSLSARKEFWKRLLEMGIAIESKASFLLPSCKNIVISQYGYVLSCEKMFYEREKVSKEEFINYARMMNL